MRRRLKSKAPLVLVSCLFPSALLFAQDVEQEEMICRDMGDIFCTLDEILESVTPDSAQAVKGKPGPVPNERQKSRSYLSVIDLQENRTESVLDLKGQSGMPAEARLINPNPEVNAWHLLKLTWNPQKTEWFHLENSLGKELKLELSSQYNSGLTLTNANGEKQPCDLWGNSSKSAIYAARSANTPYAKLCNNLVFLRNRIDGYKTTKEWVVEFLRANVAGGETITTIVKETVYKDSFLIKSEGSAAGGQMVDLPDGPEPGKLNPKLISEQITTNQLGITVEGAKGDTLDAGRWYRSDKQPGVFVSAIEPRAIEESLLKSHASYVRPR